MNLDASYGAETASALEAIQAIIPGVLLREVGTEKPESCVDPDDGFITRAACKVIDKVVDAFVGDFSFRSLVNVTPPPTQSAQNVLRNCKNDLQLAVLTEYRETFYETARSKGIDDPRQFERIFLTNTTLCISLVAVIGICTLFRLSLYDGVCSTLSGFRSVGDWQQKDRTDIIYEQAILSLVILSLSLLYSRGKTFDFLKTNNIYREARQTNLNNSVARVLMHSFENYHPEMPSGVTGKNDIMKDHFFRLMNILKSRKSDNEIFSEDFLLKREINRIFCEIDDKLNIKLVELNKG